MNRAIWGALLGWAVVTASGLADPIGETDLTRFATAYAQAVESKDSEKVRPFFHPALFSNLSEAEKKTVESWFADIKATGLQLTGPVWIHTKTLSGTLPAVGTWKVQPQYQIEMEAHHSVGNGGEVGDDEVVELVAEQDGRLYVVRPFPKAP